jgi:serine phosphatase RsbU (regulator of sigma subunit)
VPKKLFRQIEQLLREIDDSAGDEELLRDILHRLTEADQAVYGIQSGRLYRERELDYVLIASIGEYGEAIAGRSVPKSYPVVQELERRRVVIVSQDDPGVDVEVESQFTLLDSAAILVGKDPAYILSLGISHHKSAEELRLLLETIRAAVSLKLRQSALEDQLRQARAIQMSLLPRRLRQLAGFELAAVMHPAEEVGGDIYDVQRLDRDSLGIAVADASGHGLPAALQARDIVVGLRMGAARDHKITNTVQRLNKVIHQGGLASRFISLFYAELEDTGNLFYVNAGHVPPLLIGVDGEAFELPSTGPVLGPLPGARFRRGYETLEPGESLIVVSDGVTERQAPRPGDRPDDDERPPLEFGRANLIRVCREHLGVSAREMCAAIVREVKRFGGNSPWQDDATVLVLRRLPVEVYEPKLQVGAVKTPAPPPSRRRH